LVSIYFISLEFAQWSLSLKKTRKVHNFDINLFTNEKRGEREKIMN